jgi:hypothetical protein
MIKKIVHGFVHGTQTSGRVTACTYAIYRVIALVMLVHELYLGRWSTAGLILLTLALFEVPALIEKKLQIEIPNLLEWIAISFVFSSTILGELSDFYGHLPFWDVLLHLTNGFLSAGIGFSLAFLLNRNVVSIQLTPIFIAILAFCFSMTIGVVWEFLEFTADQWFGTDMQKDAIIQQINSVLLSGEHSNTVKHIEDIQKTVIYYHNESGDLKQLVVQGGYLDVGILDTMKDLFMNCIGAIIFSIFGYFYAKDQSGKYEFLENFIPKNEDE